MSDEESVRLLHQEKTALSSANSLEVINEG